MKSFITPGSTIHRAVCEFLGHDQVTDVMATLDFASSTYELTLEAWDVRAHQMRRMTAAPKALHLITAADLRFDLSNL